MLACLLLGVCTRVEGKSTKEGVAYRRAVSHGLAFSWVAGVDQSARLNLFKFHPFAERAEHALNNELALEQSTIRDRWTQRQGPSLSAKATGIRV
jgi:hypothetical protein